MKRFSLLLPAALCFLLWQSLAPQPRVSRDGSLQPVIQPGTERPERAEPAPAVGNVPAFNPAPVPVRDEAETLTEASLAAMRQDRRWEQPVTEPEFADFREWTRAAARGEATEEQGVALAQTRRTAMRDLMEKNPRRALELAVPETVRRTLPQAILAELEEPVHGRGDLLVAAALAMPGYEHVVRPVTRTLAMGGREFDTFTYGRRAGIMSREQLPVHGVALDGRLALSEWPARVLEPVQAAEARAALETPPLCPVSKMPMDENGDEVVLDFSLEQAQWYCQAGHATRELQHAAEMEAALPPGVAATGVGGGGADLPVAASSYTEGLKKMLIIRVDFPDKTGQVVSDGTLTTLINNFASHWPVMSYGKTTWAAAGAGSDFTPTLRLPNNHASYTSFGTMLNAARTAADQAGYDYRDYQFEVVVTGDKPDVGFGGVAFVGGRGAWLANGQWNLGVGSHEVGHNFGLNHSGFWDPTDGTAIGAGENVEYGNPFDHMGGASSSTNAHFSARQKNYLDWLPDADVKKVTANGTFTHRISAMDQQAATGARTVAIDRASTTSQDYWIEYRTKYSSNKWMADGAVLNFGPLSINNSRPSLLDLTPSTGSKDDSPLLIGRTFSDATDKIHITPIARGTDTTTGVPWMDIQVNRGDFTGNVKPTASLAFSPANPAVNATASFTVTAADGNGDTLSYYWDWGDDTFTANNSTTATHKWTTAGIKTVRCIVSDMKGMTATASVLVQVGTSTTFFISGYVRTAGGLPFEGVTVRAGTASDTTDSEGFYAVTGLAAGSHTVAATRTGYTFNVSGFTNPVPVGPSKPAINFLAPVGAPAFTAIRGALVDAGSNSGPVPLVITDNDTPIASLTLTGSSSNTAIVPDANIAFGAMEPRTVTVTAPTGVSGTVDITITATDPEGGTGTYVWPVTVNGPPVNTPGSRSTPENTPLEIDLRTLVADDLTTDDSIAFLADRPRNGSITLLPDGHTLRFTPAPFFNGTASFRLTSRDQSLSSATALLYDFEPDSSGTGVSSGKAADRSNFNRIGTIEAVGTGEYSGVSDVPPALAPHSTTALSLTENGTAGAAKLKRTFALTDLDWNDADWTFCAWVKRASTATEDFVFHLGDGDGHGSQDELELYFSSGGNALKLQKWNSGGLQAEVVHPGVPAGEWHYLSIVYDRTATATGTLSLYVDGFLAGTTAAVPMAVLQTRSMVVGGHADNASTLDRWLDGSLDDVMVSRSVLSRATLRQLATMGSAHQLGLADSDTVTVSVTGANQAPAITQPADAGLNTGTPSAALPFRVSDAESEHRVLTVSAASSNPALIPVSGIAVSGAPPAWASANVGTVTAAGSTVEDHGTFHISGSGAGITAAADEFRYVSQDVTGDGEIICRVLGLDVPHQSSRAGIMLRESTAVDAPFAMISVTGANGISFQSRTAAAGTATESLVNYLSAPVWLRLVRSGTTFTGYYAADEDGTPGTWQSAGTATGFTMPATVKGGMAVTSWIDGTLTTAVMDRVDGNIRLGGERTVVLTPLAGQTGTANITLTVSDGALSASTTFQAVVGINTPPTLSGVADQSITDGQTLAPFTISVGDLHTPLANLSLTAITTSSTILPPGRITFTGTGAERTVQLRPVPGESGTVQVTLMLGDGVETVSRTFNLTVLPGDPALLVSAGTNWRYLDTGSNPAGWQQTAFNDNTWPVGPAQLGFGEGDESTAVNATAARKTTYFRRTFQLADAAEWQWLQLRLVRDDGAVVWLNGQEIWRSNMPEGPVNGSTDALASVGGADESAWFTHTVYRPPFVAGTNVLAVEIHQKGTTSSDLSFDLEARALHPTPVQAVAPGAVWRYLDTGTAPAADWFSAAFDDTAWLSGAAQLGYGDGDEATVVAGGPDSSRYPTTWFRSQFTLTDRSGISGMGLRLIRDDGILVRLNGREIFRDNLPAGEITATTLASSGIANADEAKWRTVWLPADTLLEGTNQLAVEVHQSSATSSDLSFDMDLQLYRWDALPPLVCTCSASTISLTWPAWAAGWKPQFSADLRTWTDEPAVPAQTSTGYSLTLPRTVAKKYWRLSKP